MDNKDAYIKHLGNTIINLNETINGLQNQISNLTEMIMLLRKEKFASSSEKTKTQMEGQLSLFNEAEAEASSESKEPFFERKGGIVRKNAKTGREELLKDLPIYAAVYSLIETAKANGLNVYTYLEYLLLYMPDTDWRSNPEELDMLMPWSEGVQAECK